MVGAMKSIGRMSSAGVVGNLTNAAGLLSGNAKAQLIAESGGLPVVFYINPKSVRLVKSNKVEGAHGVLVGSFQDALKGSGNIRLELGDAHVTGAGVTQAAANQLIEWATPVESIGPMQTVGGMVDSAIGTLSGGGSSVAGALRSPGAAVSSARGAMSDAMRLGGGGLTPTKAITMRTRRGRPAKTKFYVLPKLLFSWGLHGPRGSNKPVTLEKVSVDYLRFDPLGLPVWAKFSMTLVEVYEEKAPQNPTSGGVPGRARHTVAQGENIVQIANRAYDSPNAWRTVAEVNGLDDPLRIRPGRTLSLPPADAAIQER